MVIEWMALVGLPITLIKQLSSSIRFFGTDAFQGTDIFQFLNILHNESWAEN